MAAINGYKFEFPTCPPQVALIKITYTDFEFASVNLFCIFFFWCLTLDDNLISYELCRDIFIEMLFTVKQILFVCIKFPPDSRETFDSTKSSLRNNILNFEVLHRQMWLPCMGEIIWWNLWKEAEIRVKKYVIRN